MLKVKRRLNSRSVRTAVVCLLIAQAVPFDSIQATTIDLPRLVVPEATTLPRVDGAPTDQAWTSAAVIPALGPAIKTDAGTLPTPSTRVCVLWSPKYLYIRFICEGTSIYAPYPGSSPSLYLGDVAEVFLDPVGDARQWYEIEISPHGGLLEKNWLMTDVPIVDEDRALRPQSFSQLWGDTGFSIKGLVSAAQITSEGWIADLAIPAEIILRRSGGHTLAPTILRANFIRYQWPIVHGKRLMIPLNWSPVRQGCPHISPGAMGYLELRAAQ